MGIDLADNTPDRSVNITLKYKQLPTREEWEALSPDDKWRYLHYANSMVGVLRSKAYSDLTPEICKHFVDRFHPKREKSKALTKLLERLKRLELSWGNKKDA